MYVLQEMLQKHYNAQSMLCIEDLRSRRSLVQRNERKTRGRDRPSAGGYQYLATGRTSIAPPRRAAGIRAASLIAASRLSASRVQYPPTAPLASTKGPFVVSVSPFCTRTVVASLGSPSGGPGVTPAVLFTVS